MKPSIRTYYIFLSSIALAFLFSYFFVGKAAGISGTIFYSLIILNFWGYKLLARKKLNQYDFVLGLNIVLSFGFFLHQNQLLNDFNSVVLILSLVPLILLSQDPKIYRRFSYLNSILSYVYITLSSFVAIPHFLRGFIPKREKGGDGEGAKKETSIKLYHVFQVLLGIIVATPILLVFFVLFISADQAFAELIGEIDINFSSGHVLAFIFFYLLYAFVAGGLVIQKLNHIAIHQNYSRSLKRGIPLIVSSTVISLVAFLFVAFIGVQFYYLFGNHDKVVDLGLTYSEYARRGFWELQAISIFSFGLIYFLQRFTNANSKNSKLVINILLSIFTLEVLIVLYSAHKRMSLYEDGYGFTELRFYPHVFMAYEALLFGYLLVALYAGKIFKYFSLYSFVLAVVFLIGMNFLNPNQYIAKKNIDRYENGKQLDVKYMFELSPDAYVQLKDVDFPAYDIYRCELFTRKAELEKRNNNWPEYNISGKKSLDTVRELTDGMSFEGCKELVGDQIEEVMSEYADKLESGDYEGALQYWSYDAEDSNLVGSIPESVAITSYAYKIDVDDRYYVYDSWLGNGEIDQQRFRFLSDIDRYADITVQMRYINDWGTYCKTDYIDFDVVNGALVIDSSSSLPLRFRDKGDEYLYYTESELIGKLHDLSEVGSESCSYEYYLR